MSYRGPNPDRAALCAALEVADELKHRIEKLERLNGELSVNLMRAEQKLGRISNMTKNADNECTAQMPMPSQCDEPNPAKDFVGRNYD